MLIFDLLFPKRCVGCGRVGAYICTFCRRTIRPVALTEMICPVCERLSVWGRTHPRCRGKYEPDGLVSWFRYTGVVRKALKIVKYRHAGAISGELLAMVPLTSHNFMQQVTRASEFVMIPIPLSSHRKRSRGFNQAELYASGFGRILAVPMEADLLKRRRDTVPQVSMENRVARLKNMRGAFAVINQDRVRSLRNQTILLVDDVFTTGATVRAATKALKRSGAGPVWALTVAR